MEPVLMAEEIIEGGKVVQWKAWCPFCVRYHWHGAIEGHREAHCDPKSPFSETGYILRLRA